MIHSLSNSILLRRVKNRQFRVEYIWTSDMTETVDVNSPPLSVLSLTILSPLSLVTIDSNALNFSNTSDLCFTKYTATHRD